MLEMFFIICWTLCNGISNWPVIIRSAKKISLVPSAMIGLMVALIALFVLINLNGGNANYIWNVDVCIGPFVLVTLAPRYITAAEVNLFFIS